MSNMLLMAATGELERAILDLLWVRTYALTVREVHELINVDRDLAYTTVMTVLDRLAKKDLLTRELDGRAWRYRVARDRVTQLASDVDELLAGLTPSDRRAVLTAAAELRSGESVVRPPKATPGDRVAVLSPSFAGPAIAPDLFEQGLRRLQQLTGLIPVEFPTTRRLGATPVDRAADVNAALADPSIRAILASIGGEDQVLLMPHLDAELLQADPKPFLGYSDNTHLLNWLWCNGVGGFYGGSTMVHLGAGPSVDPIHAESLRAALLDGGDLAISEPGESEDFGLDWSDPRSLSQSGVRRPAPPWVWAGPRRRLTGLTWGGCLESLVELALAGRLPPVAKLRGGVLLLETSEELPPARVVKHWLRALGERGVLGAVGGVLVARTPSSSLQDPEPRDGWQEAQTEAVIETVTDYNPEAVVCVGPPFGHTRPQWILPYGGELTIDGERQELSANYR